MNGAFDLSDAYELADTTDNDQAVRDTWEILARDMRDELPENVEPEHLVYVSHTFNGDDVNVVFTSPIDNLEDYLEGLTKEAV
jgi:hypothetical protein